MSTGLMSTGLMSGGLVSTGLMSGGLVSTGLMSGGRGRVGLVIGLGVTHAATLTDRGRTWPAVLPDRQSPRPEPS
jgi:hypothetical protein